MVNRIVNTVFGGILFLNFSELFRPLGVLIGLNSSFSVSIATLVISVFYIMCNRSSLLIVFNDALTRKWIIVLVVLPSILLIFPLFLGFLSTSQYFYWLSLNLMYSLLFLSSAVFAFKVPYSTIRFLTKLCLLFSIVGFILNYIYYPFIREVLAFSGSAFSDQLELFRALGFFPHPNTAALSLVVYSILLFSTNDNVVVKPHMVIIWLVIFVFLIFLTGSRTSLLLFFGLFLVYYGRVLRLSVQRYTRLSENASRFILLFSLSILVFSLFLSRTFFIGLFDGLVNDEILGRMDFISVLGSNGNTEDESLNLRSSILPKYFSDILDNPIFGVGPEFVRSKIDSGAYTNVSQNNFIEAGIYFGIPYVLYLVYCFLFSFKKLFANYYLTLGSFDGLLVLVVVLFLVSFSVSNLFWTRAVIIGFGFLLGPRIRSLRAVFNSYFH